MVRPRTAQHRARYLNLALAGGHVRLGSKADICGAKGDVRFTPNGDRESGFPQNVMSALPLKADMCVAARDVGFGPIADIGFAYLLRFVLAMSVANRNSGAASGASAVYQT
jgi:hypothetical protein